MTTPDGTQIPSLDDNLAEIGFGKFQIFAVLITGLSQFFDAAEVELLSYFGPILKCYWLLTMWEISLLPFVVFAGMLMGSILFGKLSDSYGRKTIFMTCSIVVFYFSLLCAASPTFIWLVITRFIIGFFLSGLISSSYTFVFEVITPTSRGIIGMFINQFWSLGSFYISIFLIIIVPRYGWRLWLVLPMLPMIILIGLLFWLPESPRYLLIMDRREEAIKVINRIAVINNADPISNVTFVKHKTYSVFQLFHPNYARTTVITSSLLFVGGISYYGFVFLAPIIHNIPHVCLQNMNMVSNISQSLNMTIDNSCCLAQSWTTMTTVFIAIFGELLAYLIGIPIIKFMKRKHFMQLLFLINIITYFLINLCLSPQDMGILLMFGRGASSLQLVVNYIYVSEVFPTTMRGLASGFGNCCSKIGSMFASLLVNIIMVNISFMGGTILYCCLNLLAFLFVFLLPFETKDRKLHETIDDDNPESEVLGPKQNNSD